MERSNITISPINELANIETRDMVYRDFLNMLNLEGHHKSYLQRIGFLNSTIDAQMYRSIPKKKIKRRLIANSLKRKYDLAGIPGFFQEEDWCWTFSAPRGFFIPLFDEHNRIQALSIHLDEEFNGISDMWFSSNGKINGTATKNWISKNNVNTDTENVILTDDLLLGNLIKAILNVPIISFSSIIFEIFNFVAQKSSDIVAFDLHMFPLHLIILLVLVCAVVIRVFLLSSQNVSLSSDGNSSKGETK